MNIGATWISRFTEIFLYFYATLLFFLRPFGRDSFGEESQSTHFFVDCCVIQQLSTHPPSDGDAAATAVGEATADAVDDDCRRCSRHGY